METKEIAPGFDGRADDKLVMEPERLGEDETLLLLRLSGYIDTYNSAQFQRQVQKILDAGYCRLILDLESLSYISSTGIYVLISILRSCQKEGGDIVLVAANATVHDVFDILGFSSFFVLRAELREAIDYFREHKEIVAV